MNFLKAAISMITVSLLVGCASIPRELASHKLIPNGEYTGKAENNRPEELKYQKLPDNVEYVRASDSLVLAVHQTLKKSLESGDPTVTVAKYLFLMPGAWENIKDDPNLPKSFKKQKDKFVVQVTKKKKFKFPYAIPKDPKSAMIAWGVVYQQIRNPEAAKTETEATETAEAVAAETAPAEIRIRAISTKEMETLVGFSPFKMVEPLFVVNDRYLLGFNAKGELEVLDELPYYIPFYEEAMEAINNR